jgi:hypothetical protein
MMALKLADLPSNSDNPWPSSLLPLNSFLHGIFHVFQRRTGAKGSEGQKAKKEQRAAAVANVGRRHGE